MGGEACACAPTPPRLLPEPEPDHLYDHHSSEEELEVINGALRGAGATGAGAGAEGPSAGTGAAESRRRGASSPPPAAPEKRKWPAQPYLDPDNDEHTPRPASSDDDDTKTLYASVVIGSTWRRIMIAHVALSSELCAVPTLATRDRCALWKPP
uniref:SFRICE_038245 n=1 Tax=Spodoptera frugiperda TaxID=7108 RepID=A0A2H1VR15_SPOFR